MRRSKLTVATAVCVGFAGVCTPAKADAITDFYAGKTITVIVGYAPGGGYDTYARLMIKHFPNYMPGKPAIIPKYMPGGATTKAASFVYKVAPQDGTVIGLVGSSLPSNAFIYGNVGDGMDIAKFNWIGRMAKIESIGGIWHGKGIKSFEDLKKQEVVFGGTSARGKSVTVPYALNRLLGTKIKVVKGYRGSSRQLVALEKGEIEGMANVVWAQLKRARPGWAGTKIIPLFQATLERRSDLPNIPTIVELAKNDEDRKVFSILASDSNVGRPFMIGPAVPPARVAALRTAFMAMVRDKNFLAEAEKLKIDIDPLSGEELQSLIADLAKFPKSVFDRTRKLIKP